MKEEMKKIEEEKAAAKKENSTGDSESSENKKEDEASDDAVSETSVEITNRLKDTFHMMFDYSLGERLRNKIIPKAVLYMTGDAQDSDREGPDNDDDDDEDDDEDYYDEYDGDEYYDEDDDDDYDDHVRRQHMAVWNREMSERVFNNPIVRQGINPGNCAQS